VFVRIQELPEGSDVEADLCIVGAGAAGIAIARSFIGSQIKVALLESGGFDLDPETQSLANGETLGEFYPDLSTVRLRYFGGTTNHWAGQSSTFDPIDFEARDWVSHSGWPISYAEYARYLDRAQSVCALTLPPGSSDPWSLDETLPEFPLPEESFEPEIFRYSEPTIRFGEAYRGDIEAAENVTCYLYANLVGLTATEGGGAVQKAEIASLDGRRASVKAKIFILAAGGIENSRLLLLARLGSGFRNVGRYFMEHPNYRTARIVIGRPRQLPYLVKPRASYGGEEVRLDFKLSPQEQREQGILNHSAYLRAQRSRKQDAGVLVKLWNKVVGKFDDLLGGDEELPVDYELLLRLEHAPNPESRVELGDETDALGLRQPRLVLNFSGLESRTLDAMLDSTARGLGASNIGRMQFEASDPDWIENAGWQFHHCGGTRMHDDPSKGVVDPDCRVHGVANLYVAGSSVFPTSGHANPTMNLLALGYRLADRIKEEFT